MKKTTILQALLAELESELRRQKAANEQASAGATDSQARAETRWDTCGLESSYLARGHANQFKALAAQVHELRTFRIPLYDRKPIGPGALVDAVLDGEVLCFFLLPCGGGVELSVEGVDVTVITPESPVGAALLDKKQGDVFSFRAGTSGKILKVC
jgi:hypothetical protein